jgi:hypothetical protein
MRALPIELRDFATTTSPFAEHVRELPPTASQLLATFLSATMDEVRLLNASRFTKCELTFTDLGDADHFRQGLLRREISGQMAYPNQRDHSAHTLHNYLLGWYAYCHAESLRTALHGQFWARGSKSPEGDFRDSWPIVSLLHDIGYLFEGAVLPLATTNRDRNVCIGAEVSQDYFEHRFWVECGFDSVYDRQQLRAMSKVHEPDFSSPSISGVADALRSLGELEGLRQAIQSEITQLGDSATQSFFNQAQVMSGDAFDVWEKHYLCYGFPSMADRIARLRGVFEGLLADGLGMTGLRILDHGVCSGLLLLLYSTFYFRIYFGLPADLPPDQYRAALWRKFKGLGTTETVGYEALWWWQGVVWATAAVAIHNVQQLQPREGYPGSGPLGLDEDALAYLGILVDCAQEWDRYTVSRESVLGGLLPLQGSDVLLGTENGKVRLHLGDSSRTDKVRRSLNYALRDWDRFLVLE